MSLYVGDPLQRLSNTTEQTDRAVAGRIQLVFSPFWEWVYESFLPDCSYSARRPALVVETKVGNALLQGRGVSAFHL